MGHTYSLESEKMASDRYRPLNGDEVDGDQDSVDSTLVGRRNHLHIRIIYAVVFSLSVTINVLLLISYAGSSQTSTDRGRTKYSE